MKIETTFPSALRANVRNFNRATRPPSDPALEGLSCSRSLEMALAAVPDVRASEVARGKALVADPNYPSREQIKNISHTLARHWKRLDSRPANAAVSIKPML